MLQRSIQSVSELTSRACGQLIEMDVTTKIPASWSCLKAIFQHNTWKQLSEAEKIISRLWNYSIAPATQKQGSHSPLPPTEVGANATPHEVGANATPVPLQKAALSTRGMGFLPRNNMEIGILPTKTWDLRSLTKWTNYWSSAAKGHLGHTFWGLINRQGFKQRILPQPKKWCEGAVIGV